VRRESHQFIQTFQSQTHKRKNDDNDDDKGGETSPPSRIAGTKPVQAGEGKERRQQQQQQGFITLVGMQKIAQKNQNQKPEPLFSAEESPTWKQREHRSAEKEHARFLTNKKKNLKNPQKSKNQTRDTEKLFKRKPMRSSLPEATQDHFQHECFGPKNNSNRSQMATAKTRNGQKQNKKARLYFVPAKLKG